MTINGNSHTIDGASSYRIFDISTPYNSDGNAAAQRVITINNLTMRNGSSSEGGAIRVNGARADNLASLTLSNCNVYNSSSSAHAGGIFARNALLNVQSTTLMSGNSAAHSGGAIWADTSTVNIIGSSTLTYNTAGIYGGSIHAIDTTLTINQAAITDLHVRRRRWRLGILLRQRSHGDDHAHGDIQQYFEQRRWRYLRKPDQQHSGHQQ